MTINQAIDELVRADMERLGERRTRSYCARANGLEGKAWTHETTYTFRDGKQINLTGEYADQLVFPASHGCDLLYFARPQDGDPTTFDIAAHLRREPIIAWRLDYQHDYSFVTAITPEGGQAPGRPHPFCALTFLDGRVTWQRWPGADSRPPTLSAWIENVREVWASQIKSEAEEAQRKLEAQRLCPRCGWRNCEEDDDIPF